MASQETWSFAEFAAAVGDAVWAPSVHNSQPWRFRRTAHGIDVLIDRSRILATGDPHGRAARVSCGAAAYNLRLALAVAGTPAASNAGGGDVLVRLTPDRPRPATPLERRLHRQIRQRHTNRHPFADTQVEPGAAMRLADAAAREGGWLRFVEGEAALRELAALIRQADTQLNTDPAYAAELRAWTRDFDDAGEGIGRRAAGGAPHPAELLTRRDFGGPAHDITRDPARNPMVAVLGVPGGHPADDVLAGMVLQHVLLLATDLGLAAAMYSQPIEVAAVREQLRLVLHQAYAPQLVLRFGYAPAIGSTGRRPVDEVIVAGEAGNG